MRVYGKTFVNCILHFSVYNNGNLKVSVFGMDPDTSLRGHFLDISLEQNEISLADDCIVVNNRYKPEIVEQLENLGILQERIRMCVISNTIYPVYSVNIPESENYSYIEDRELCAA